MAAYVGTVMNNSVANIVIRGFSKRNESYRSRLDVPLLVCVCCTVLMRSLMTV